MKERGNESEGVREQELVTTLGRHCAGQASRRVTARVGCCDLGEAAVGAGRWVREGGCGKVTQVADRYKEVQEEERGGPVVDP